MNFRTTAIQNQVVFISDAYFPGHHQDVFRDELLRDRRIVSARITRQVPGSPAIDGTEIYPKNNKGNAATIHANIYHVDYDFLKTFGMELSRRRFRCHVFPPLASRCLRSVFRRSGRPLPIRFAP